MARKPNQVQLVDGEYWLGGKLAAEKTGLSKPELARRAIAGKIRFLDDQFGNPLHYAQTDLTPLIDAFRDKQQAKAKKPPRPKSLKQLEREWAAGGTTVKDGTVLHGTAYPTRLGPVAKHQEKVMLWEIHDKPKKG
jgi:hypothetical protein